MDGKSSVSVGVEPTFRIVHCGIWSSFPLGGGSLFDASWEHLNSWFLFPESKLILTHLQCAWVSRRIHHTTGLSFCHAEEHSDCGLPHHDLPALLPNAWVTASRSFALHISPVIDHRESCPFFTGKFLSFPTGSRHGPKSTSSRNTSLIDLTLLNPFSALYCLQIYTLSLEILLCILCLFLRQGIAS